MCGSQLASERCQRLDITTRSTRARDHQKKSTSRKNTRTHELANAIGPFGSPKKIHGRRKTSMKLFLKLRAYSKLIYWTYNFSDNTPAIFRADNFSKCFLTCFTDTRLGALFLESIIFHRPISHILKPTFS